MNKIIILVTVLSAFTSISFASGGYNSKNNCVISFGKVVDTNDNLVIACDGELILKVKTASYQPGVEKDLFVTFQSMVNSDGAKKCEQFNQENIWWASCLR